MIVALSGGGFRAALAGLGTLRFLADADLLSDVRWVSSVSGGSVANGVLAAALPRLRSAQMSRKAFDEHVLVPFVDLVSAEALTSRLLRRAWKVIGPTTRTHLLADQFDELYFHGLRLTDLDPDWRFIFNAANTSTGVRFGFERDVIGDYVIGQIPTPTSLRLATAVACSAAVPGLLAPLVLNRHREMAGAAPFPCRGNRDVRLVDGGAYDNMGLEPVDDIREGFLVALNAGGLFVTGAYGKVPVIRDLQLAQSMLYRQSTALRRRAMVERFRAFESVENPATGIADPAELSPWARHGVLFGLSTTMSADERTAVWRRANPREPDPDRVARVKTSFDRFDRQLCSDLVHAGWWLAGACIATYHPHLLPDPANPPTWTQPW